MGLTKISDEFLFGSPVSGAYVRVAKMLYSTETQCWDAEVRYYMSIQSRETEKLIDHLKEQYDSTIYTTKPEGMTDARWEKIKFFHSIQGLNILGRVNFGVSKIIFGVDTIDKDAVYQKMYEHLKLQICAGSDDVLEDATIENIMSRFLPE